MSGKTKVRLVCAVFLSAGIFRLSAQEVGGDTITGKVHQIEKVTVTARRSPNKVTSAVPIQTMSRQDISQLGIQSMADAVRRFAGANVKDYGGIGGLKTVSIRNMGAAHTAVSYDGVAVSNCQAGQIDIGRFSLDNVSMRFETGKLYGIIGPAGAGKTTLFRLMLRLMQPAAGNIEYRADGRVISFSDFSENIAYMPQSQSLYADLSINEHLDFFKKLYGIGDSEYAQKKQVRHLFLAG